MECWGNILTNFIGKPIFIALSLQHGNGFSSTLNEFSSSISRTLSLSPTLFLFYLFSAVFHWNLFSIKVLVFIFTPPIGLTSFSVFRDFHAKRNCWRNETKRSVKQQSIGLSAVLFAFDLLLFYFNWMLNFYWIVYHTTTIVWNFMFGLCFPCSRSIQ